jgi:dTDP-4-dehydrorhamnose reductase
MKVKPVILVTGSNGQLGNELRDLASSFSAFDFIFTTRENLSIDHFHEVSEFFEKNNPQYCINCAAYTQVDAAETHHEEAFKINAAAVSILADVCEEYQTRFIHFSTDYVFDGSEAKPYTEQSPTNPINVYGASKLAGENDAEEMNPETIIIRTSWVYSSYGKNFVKTMIRLMNERGSVNVVNDQIGSPTYAADLAEVIIKIISDTEHVPSHWHPGIYHFSNEGVISWFDFATEIKRLTASSCEIKPIPAAAYPTPAKRPVFSVLNKSKISETFGIELKNWKESLAACLKKIEQS